MKNILSILLILSTPFSAIAQEADAEGPGMSSLVIQLLIIFAIFYFLIIRPQQKKVKAHHEMSNALQKGDKVITQGGVIGSVVRAKEGEKFIEVEIADSVTVNILRSTISEKVSGDISAQLPVSKAGTVKKTDAKKANKKAPKKPAKKTKTTSKKK